MTNDELIEEMTAAALTSYEWSCEWAKAADAAHELARELGGNPSRGLVLHAVNLAKIQWGEMVIKTKNEIKGGE